jgi:hypothetical protein
MRKVIGIAASALFIVVVLAIVMRWPKAKAIVMGSAS